VVAGGKHPSYQKRGGQKYQRMRFSGGGRCKRGRGGQEEEGKEKQTRAWTLHAPAAQ
jgi:hypothetical protein